MFHEEGRGWGLKLHMKGTMNSDYLNQAGNVVLGPAVQFASSFYRPLSIVARTWTSSSAYFYAETSEIRRSSCCESSLHSVKHILDLCTVCLQFPRAYLRFNCTGCLKNILI